MTLKHGDLRDLVYYIVEIDAYKSKMGADKDIITLSFSTKTKESANDLETFLERGYQFVLDADSTSGEQSDGMYRVFVEIERDSGAHEQIMELVDGVRKLCSLDDLKFRYYKNWKSNPLTLENLSAAVPVDPDNYGVKVTESNLENYKNFFNRSFVESVDMWDDILKIKKQWADPVYFRVLEFGDKEEVLSSLNENINVNDFAEIIFLTKYIGDYNITKYGNKLTLENEGKTVVLSRL